MTRFTTFEQDGRSVHIFPTAQFQTRHISVRLVWPLKDNRLTATAVLPYLLLEGTRQHPSAKSVMQYADELFGAVVRTGIGKRGTMHVVEASGSVPEESAISGASGLFSKVEELLFQIVADPYLQAGAFPEEHVDRERTLHQKRIESLFDDKVAYALERCLEEMGRDETFGLPRLGYAKDLSTLSGESLRQTHRDLLKEAHVHVYIIGNVGDAKSLSASVFEHLQSLLGDTQATRSVMPPVTPLNYRSGDVRYVEEPQDVKQGKLNLGFRTQVAYAAPDYPAMLVTNGILGGFPHSKLFVNVREKASLAYYASSRLDGLTGVVAVQTGIDPQNYEQALGIIVQQVEELKKGTVSQQELEFTKNGLRNQYLQSLDAPMSIVDIHFSGVLAGTNRDVGELLSQLAAVEVEDVIEIAQSLQQDTVYFLGNRGEQVDA